MTPNDKPISDTSGTLNDTDKYGDSKMVPTWLFSERANSRTTKQNVRNENQKQTYACHLADRATDRLAVSRHCVIPILDNGNHVSSVTVVAAQNVHT